MGATWSKSSSGKNKSKSNGAADIKRSGSVQLPAVRETASNHQKPKNRPMITSALEEKKAVMSSAESLHCLRSLEEYLKDATIKPNPGLLFKEVLPFEPLSSAALVDVEVGNVSELAARLRDLRRTLKQDTGQLFSFTDIKQSGSQKQRRLSQKPMGNRWMHFQAADKEALGDTLSRLTCDERLEVLAILSEMKQQLGSYEADLAKSRQRTRALWLKVKMAYRYGSLTAAQQAKTAAVSAATATIAPTSGHDASQLYEAALLAHDRQQGWARLLSPTLAERKVEEKDGDGDEKQSAVETPAADSKAWQTPPAFTQLRQDLAECLGISRKLPLVSIRDRLMALQDHCALAHRISECAMHLQHETQLARQVLAQFKSEALKDDPELVQAVCQLATAQDPELLRVLLGTLIDSIKAQSLLQVHVLQGLATVLQQSRAEDLGLGDLNTILNLLIERTENIGSDLSEEDALQLLQTLGAVLSSMALVSQQRSAEQAARTQQRQVAQTAAAALPKAVTPSENPLLKAKRFFLTKKSTLLDVVDGPSDESGLAILGREAYEVLCQKLSDSIIRSVQTRYGKTDLGSKNPEVYFAVLVIRQALMRLAHKEQPRSEKLIQGALQFFNLLESAKDAITGFSMASLLTAATQLVDFVKLTPLGDRIQGLLSEEEEQPQPWFEQFLVLKTLVDSDQLPELEKALIGGSVSLNYPLCLGMLQLLGSVVRTEGRVEVRKGALLLLNLFMRESVWKWPSNLEFTQLNTRLRAQCEKDYAVDSRLTLEQRRHQQSYQRSQSQSQVLLRSARRQCQERDLSYQLHDYCLLQSREARQDKQWVQDEGRYIPALAKRRLDDTDDNAELFYPVFESFLSKGRSSVAGAMPARQLAFDEKAGPGFSSVPVPADVSVSISKAQSALLIMGDAGTGKSLFIRRDHVQACARYIARQFDCLGEQSAVLGSSRFPVSLHLYLNQSPVENPLEHYLKQQGFTESQVRQLKEQAYLLVHLDGYDEWSTAGQNPWIFGPKALGSWVSPRAQVIVTCRSQHLQGNPHYKDYFMPPRKDLAFGMSSGQDSGALAEWIITRLDEGGVAKLTEYYVKDETAQGKSPWSSQQYLRQFTQSGVEALVRTPIILLMALQVLPVLGKQLGEDTRILRLDIYREFIAQYMDGQRSKKLARGEGQLTGLIEAAQAYAQALALTFFSQEKAAVSYQPPSRFSDFILRLPSAFDRFFESGSPNHLLAEVIPLRVNAQRNVHDGSVLSQYSFIHKSILDYFTALGLYADLNGLVGYLEAKPPQPFDFGIEDTSVISASDASVLPLVLASQASGGVDSRLLLPLAIQWEASQSYARERRQWDKWRRGCLGSTPWGSRAINMEQSVIDFLREILAYEERCWQAAWPALVGDAKALFVMESPRQRFGRQLSQVVEASRTYPRELGQASANAATVLNALDFPLSHCQWQGVQLAGADLSDAALTGTDLSGANLHGATLSRVQFICTNLSGTDLRGARFGEYPRIEGLEEKVEALAHHPRLPQLAVAQGSDILLLDRDTGNLLGRLSGHEGGVTSVFYSPDGLRVVSGSKDNTVRIWDAMNFKVLGLLVGHTEEVVGVSYSPDGLRVVSGSEDGTIRIWDAVNFKVMKESPRLCSVTTVSYSPDGSRVISGSAYGDSDIRIFDAVSLEELGVLSGHDSTVTSVSYSPDGLRVVSASRHPPETSGGDHDRIFVWDAVSFKILGKLCGHEDGVSSVAFSPDGLRVVSGSDDGTVRIWDAVSFKALGEWRGHKSGVISVSYSPDGLRVISGSSDRTVRVWDAVNFKTLEQSLTGHTSVVNSVSYSPDGLQVASGSDDRTVQIWDAVNFKALRDPLNSDEVSSVSYSPDGLQVMAGGGSRYYGYANIRCWDVGMIWNTRIIPTSIDVPDINMPEEGSRVELCRLSSVSYRSDGLQVVLGGSVSVKRQGYNGAIQIWDKISGKLIKLLPDHTSVINSVSYSPDGLRMVSGGGDEAREEKSMASGSRDDYAIQIWDAVDFKAIGVLHGHKSGVTSVSYSRDGLRVVSGSYDKTVRIWDAVNFKELAQLSGHTSAVNSVSYSPDGLRVVSGSDDSTVRIWDAVGFTALGVLSWHSAVKSISLISLSGAQPELGFKMAMGDGSGHVSFWSWVPDKGFMPSGQSKQPRQLLRLQGVALKGARMEGMTKRLFAQNQGEVSEVLEQPAVLDSVASLVAVQPSFFGSSTAAAATASTFQSSSATPSLAALVGASQSSLFKSNVSGGTTPTAAPRRVV